MQQHVFSKTAKTLLGTGVFTWTATERQTNRYGSVYLIKEGGHSLVEGPWPSLIDETIARRFDGFAGDLIAVVKIARESTHIGDLFHGVYPRKPEVGQIIVLGNGQLFTLPAPDGGIGVGLRPSDGRTTMWLGIRALYDAHEQTVELSFVPNGAR
jgi:hypothetical protein